MFSQPIFHLQRKQRFAGTSEITTKTAYGTAFFLVLLDFEGPVAQMRVQRALILLVVGLNPSE